MSKPEENKPKVHLIGLSHRAQMKDRGKADTGPQQEFRACLEETLERLKPNLVAEELSEYALKIVSAQKRVEQESLSKLIADSRHVEHRFCDPDGAERKKMGYVEGSTIFQELMLKGGQQMSNEELNLQAYATEVYRHWPAREKFWLNELAIVSKKVIIFICGDGHVDSFQSLLKRNGIESNVVKRGIGLTNYDVEFSKKLHLYIDSHPELFC